MEHWGCIITISLVCVLLSVPFVSFLPLPLSNPLLSWHIQGRLSTYYIYKESAQTNHPIKSYSQLKKKSGSKTKNHYCNFHFQTSLPTNFILSILSPHIYTHLHTIVTSHIRHRIPRYGFPKNLPFRWLSPLRF